VAQPDYYQLLGIPSSATVEQIKAAYRRQALRYHPDKNPDAADAVERFKLCSEAYTALSDPERRAEYDLRHQGRGVQDLARNVIGDILGRRGRRRDGSDLRFDLRLTLAEAAAGVTKRISFPATEVCRSCGGNGAAPGGTAPCPTCGGRGDLREGGGLLSLPRPCPRCGGQGLMVTKACTVCGGVGTVEQERSYTVKLPAGVRGGDVKILDGEGEKGRGGGRSGDLHIIVALEPHPLLRLDGSDIALDLPVRLRTAAMGGAVTVPTLSGTVRMKIPAGTQSGRTFRLRGKGFPATAGRGDQLVRVVVETPVALDLKARDLLQAFDESCGPGSHPMQEAFVAGVDEAPDPSG